MTFDLGTPRGKRADSRWLKQTKIGGPNAPEDERGDCLPACIASVLGVPLERIRCPHNDSWWDDLREDLAALGYCVINVRDAPECYWVATLPSLNLGTYEDGRPVMHCVVARGPELVHDPAVGETYAAETFRAAFEAAQITEGWAFAPLDPEYRPTREEVEAEKAAAREAGRAEAVEDVVLAMRSAVGGPDPGYELRDAMADFIERREGERWSR